MKVKCSGFPIRKCSLHNSKCSTLFTMHSKMKSVSCFTRFLNLPFNSPGYRIFKFFPSKSTWRCGNASRPPLIRSCHQFLGTVLDVNGHPGRVQPYQNQWDRSRASIFFGKPLEFGWLIFPNLIGWLVGVLWLIERISNISLPAILVFIDIQKDRHRKGHR